MNAALIVLFCVAWLIFAYFWYGRVLNRRVIHPDPEARTPAIEINDGIDYVPAHSAVLFGHHFSSIAGAGPIVGPIIAMSLFGWLPALLWILLGSVFMGAVHDYVSLMTSLRNKGISIVEIAATAVSPTARAVFAVFVWLTLTLVQAVFADLTAATIVEMPQITIPTVGLILNAILFGILVNRMRLPVWAGTILALTILATLIWLGNMFPLSVPYSVALSLTFVYAFIAAVVPVWILLQPRDYISMYILILGMVLGFVGIVVAHPPVGAPAFIAFTSKTGPIFPTLFIIVACGAVSGFHSIVSSGTTAKQLRSETHGRRVAFGGMLTEAALGVLVLMMVSGVLVWKSSPTVTGSFVFQDLLAMSPNIVFGTALGRVGEVLGIPLAVGVAFGILMLNAFILTTLDTTTRLNRYIMQETLGRARGGIFRNPYFASAATVVPAFLLTLGKGYQFLWPVFGASNQLIAALALFVVTAYLFGIKRPLRYTLLPAIFMLAVTELSLLHQMLWLYLPHGDWALLGIAFVLFVLGLVVASEAWKALRKRNPSLAS